MQRTCDKLDTSSAGYTLRNRKGVLIAPARACCRKHRTSCHDVYGVSKTSLLQMLVRAS